jgi:glyoxylase-like metal-dependent hydrolase (beta-lactamase superfamily II)
VPREHLLVAPLVQLTPTVWLLRFPIVNAYIVRTTEGVAIVDTGPVGSDGDVIGAISELGVTAADLRWIVLTHCHKDHVGSAAALAEMTDAVVLAGAKDAPVIAGLVPEPEASITHEERSFYDRIAPTIPPAPRVKVDRVLHEGDHIDWGQPIALVVDAPGHTPGSIALYLPDDRVLFTGDNIASLGAKPILGPFNVARGEAIESFRKLAQLDFEVACFGHGDPLIGDAGSDLRRVAPRL